MDNFNKAIREKTFKILDTKIITYISILLSILSARFICGAYSSVNRFVLSCLAFALSKVVIYALLFIVIFGVLYLPRAIKWNGIIHRLEFFLVLSTTGFISNLVDFLCFPDETQVNYDNSLLVKIIIGLILLLFIIYIEVCATIKRLKDLKWSKKWAFVGLIPFVCILINLPCLFIKGKVENNNLEESKPVDI